MHQHDPSKSLAILAIGLLIASGSARAGEATGWDAQAAATYLDGRAAEWAAFKGADRGQGKDKVSCLSCHTSVSYALGRPALRQVTGEDRPTAHEARQLEQVRRPRGALGRARHAPLSPLLRPRRAEEGRVLGHRGRPECPGPRLGRPPSRARRPERLDEAGPSEPLGDAAQGWARSRLVGLARLRAPSLGSQRGTLLRDDARRHRRRHGPRVSQG